MKSRLFWLDVAVKLLLVGLLLYAVTHQSLHQFHGKRKGTRAVI